MARGASSPDSAEDWRVRQMLVDRLGAEWYRIGVLKRELSHIGDIASDLRNLELYPESITRLSDERLAAFDRTIEQIENRREALAARINALRAPLADALAILREMVTGEPVEDMYRVLEQGDMRRLAVMMDIKHDVDNLWKDAQRVIAYARREMEIGDPSPAPPEPDEEFFDILKANLGRQWEEYYQHMARIKDTLAARAAPAELRRLFAIEQRLVSSYIQRDKHQLAMRKLSDIGNRYRSQEIRNEVKLLKTRVHFTLGDYRASLRIAETLPDTPPLKTTRDLFMLQNRYALRQYDTIWSRRDSVDYLAMSGARRNLAIWITIEAGLARDREFDYSHLAGLMAKDAPYAIHVLHALARTYASRDKWPTALSVLQSALRIKPLAPVDHQAHRRVQVTMAHTLYEIGEYSDALSRFFALLTRDQGFDEALFGMAWCYIAMGQFQKAEATLRTLINQNPESPRAAQAILLMAKRFVNKAQHEWKKKTFLAQQEQAITALLEKIDARMRADSTSPAAAKRREAVNELRTTLERIRSEKTASPRDIDGFFDKARKICMIVPDLYKTGSFQEVSFSARRERMLHELDSVMLAIRNDSKRQLARETSYARARDAISYVKELVKKSRVMAAEVMIHEYHWRNAYLEHQKSDITRRQRELAVQCDTAHADSSACAHKRARLTAALDSLVTAGDGLRRDWQRTYPQTVAPLLASDLASEDAIYLRYHLAELYYAWENARFAAAYERYELSLSAYQTQMDLFHDGAILQMPAEPAAPALDHDSSIAHFRRIIETYPEYPQTAPARYGLAWCYNDLGASDSAVAHMRIVAARHPDSRYAAQAWMYVGEHLFDNARLDEAIEAYQAVMNYPESEWFDEALYKLAWTQYRLSNPEKAISSFLALVDLGDAEAARPLLEKESMDYIAISFSESDVTGEKGLQRAADFVDRFGDEQRGSQILHRLAAVYREQGRFDMAKKTYRTLLEKYPENPRNYLVESELLAVREREADLVAAADMKVRYFETYGRQSDWARAQSDQRIAARADSAAEAHLYDAAISLHQNALQNNDSTEYVTASNTYRRFIKAYPSSPHANECHYNLAEILFSLGNYAHAAQEYMAVSKRYPDSKYRETAAWNAIVSSQNLLRLETEVSP
jgi:TolA-binding protein